MGNTQLPFSQRRAFTNPPQQHVAEVQRPNPIIDLLNADAIPGDAQALCLGTTDRLDAKNTKWDSDFVTQATQKLLDEFEALPDRDRSELFAGLARRVAAPHGLPQDDDLVAVADQLFLDLDRREPPERRR